MRIIPNIFKYFHQLGRIKGFILLGSFLSISIPEYGTAKTNTNKTPMMSKINPIMFNIYKFTQTFLSSRTSLHWMYRPVSILLTSQKSNKALDTLNFNI